MSDLVGDLRPLTFTIGQLREILLGHWFHDRPASIEGARQALSAHLELEWLRQDSERREMG